MIGVTLIDFRGLVGTLGNLGEVCTLHHYLYILSIFRCHL